MPVLLIARRSDDYQHDVLITPLLLCSLFLFFFNDTATTEIYTLSLHDALPIYSTNKREEGFLAVMKENPGIEVVSSNQYAGRSEEHTSELQSPDHLVCRLLLEKKKHTTRRCCTHHLHTCEVCAIASAQA